jgi:hypothetical protein
MVKEDQLKLFSLRTPQKKGSSFGPLLTIQK